MTDTPAQTPRRVVFICVENSNRSASHKPQTGIACGRPSARVVQTQ